MTNNLLVHFPGDDSLIGQIICRYIWMNAGAFIIWVLPEREEGEVWLDYHQ